MYPDIDFSNSPLAEFGEWINKYAKQNELDPYLVAAIIWVESKGNPDAVNKRSQATGLGQVMPKEAGSVFSDRPSTDELKKPELNIMWTCKILGYYRKKLGTDYDAAYRYSGGSYWSSEEDFTNRYWRKVVDAKALFSKSNPIDNIPN
jgi:soluble lytic murein transglycosylase-like protein